MEKKLTRVVIRNFAGIEELDLAPGGKLTAIEGPNASGKSTVLNAIAQALSGGGASKYELVRLGPDGERAEKAEILLEIEDVSILRSFTPSGGSLSISQGEFEAKQPQSLLDRLFPNHLAFNPVEFLNAKPAEQRAMLFRLVPCDLTVEDLEKQFGVTLPPKILASIKHPLDAISAITKLLEEQRRDANRARDDAEDEAKRLKADVPEDFDPVAAEALDASELQKVIRAHDAALLERQHKEEKAASIRRQIDKEEQELQFLNEKLAALQEQIAAKMSALQEQRTALNAALEEALAVIVPSDDEAQASLERFTAQKAMLETYKRAQAAEAKAASLREDAAKLQAALEEARSMPATILANAKLPLDGLGLTDEGITYEGKPLHLLSTSEQVRVCLGIVRESIRAQGGLKLILVDDLEHLDPDVQSAFLEAIKDDDFQYIVTRVSSEPGLPGMNFMFM